MKNVLSHKAVENFKYLVLVYLAIIFLMLLVASFGWRVRGDSVFLHYLGYLMNEHGFVPYRDFFEINMPGTYLFHSVVGKLFGYSDFALRLLNISWLTATLVVTGFIMKPFGKVAAFASCLLFGSVFLSHGPDLSLQRDFIVILPMAIALLLTIQRKPNHSVRLMYFLIGVLFAIVALIKPYHAIGLPALILFTCIQDNNISAKNLIKPCIVGGVFVLFGFLLSMLIPFLWLWQIGGLQNFWDIFISYTPLYGQMSGDLSIREPLSHIMHTLSSYFNHRSMGLLMVSALFAQYLVLNKPISFATKKLSILLCSLAILYAIAAAIGGKLWDYHLIPYMYFVSLSTAILFSPLLVNVYRPSLLPLLVFLLTSTHILQYNIYHQVIKKWSIPNEPKDMRRDEMTTYLKAHLLPTDEVQALSWAGGTMEALLASKAIPATSYVTDFQFYHHVSTPYIQHLRADFMTQLAKKRPRFIIDVSALRQISGLDTTYEFQELETFIKQHYKKDYTGEEFVIFRRNDD